ncbi:DinB family protein [Chloroflexia bacterium SDU3-3]|nr:DinB family protein [Chloroflexia bacterium SDU3-3]
MDLATITQELQHSATMIRALVVGVSPEQARQRPSADAWSMLEVVCHLYDEEREDFREHLDFILHRQGGEWYDNTPEEWVTQRAYHQQDIAKMLEKFLDERGRSLAWLAGLQSPDWDKSYTMPDYSISAGDMLACWAAHDNLHIRQLVEIRRALIEQMAAPYALSYAGEW